MPASKSYICALDVGTTKVIAAISEYDNTGNWRIVGFGQVPCRGLRKGIVVDVEVTKAGIVAALELAEKQAGVKVENVIVGVAGKHIRCINSYGIVGIQGEKVTELDIARVIEAARAVALPDNERALHVLPQEFFIDGQEGIKDPMNMTGVRLEAKVHIVVASDTAVQNVVNCVEQCGLIVQDVVLEQLASSYAVLTKDEMDLGVCLVDIGGGTADIAVFANGAIRYSSALPIAGDQATSDLAIVLRTDIETAEKIKVEHADIALSETNNQDQVTVTCAAENTNKEYSLKLIAQVVHARYEELYVLVLDQLRRCGIYDRIRSGIVITGGGSMVLGGKNLAEKALSMPVRQAKPKLNEMPEYIAKPECSTVVGLIIYFLEQNKSGKERININKDNLMNKMKKWLVENF